MLFTGPFFRTNKKKYKQIIKQNKPIFFFFFEGRKKRVAKRKTSFSTSKALASRNQVLRCLCPYPIGAPQIWLVSTFTTISSIILFASP